MAAGRRRWLRVVVSALVVVTVALVAVGWYVSGEIIAGMSAVPPEPVFDVEVSAIEDQEIELLVEDEVVAVRDADSTLGLRWDGGWGIVGSATAVDGDAQTRPFGIIAGGAPSVGDLVSFDGVVYPDLSALDFPLDEVFIDAPIGSLPAWYVEGSSDTWVIGVHGLGAGRRDMLRMVQALGPPSDYHLLIPSYRNDIGTPTTDDQLALFGQTEWEDLTAAVDFARAQGAEHIVLHGQSMGGAIVLSYLLEAGDAAGIIGVVLDAPAADFARIIDLRSGEALPVGGAAGDAILSFGRYVTTLRTGLDFAAVDYVERADGLDVPILLLHGTEDTIVPFEVGEALAEARPDLVELVPIEDAGHVRAWNEDATAYTVIVTEFIRDRVGASN
ncbi:MAG: alpha/beta hydrolase [Acidimicrobiia bacterium]